MADRIIVSTEAMDELISQIRKLSSGLDAVKSDIRAVRMDKSSGADVHIALPSGVLGSIHRALRSGEAESCLSDIAKATEDVGRYTDRLSGYVNAAMQLFEKTENNLIRSYGSLTSEESMFNGICRALGFGTDKSRWTPQMHDKYQELLDKAEVVVDGGFTLLASKEMSLLFGENGLLGSYEEESSFTKLKQTLKTYGEHNWSEKTTEKGVQYAGFKGKVDVLEREMIAHKQGAYDVKNKKKTDYPDHGTKLGILSVGGTTGKSWNALGAQGAYDGEHLDAKGNASLLQVEGHATGNAGLGVYLPNEKGELELYYGATGEVGASVSVAQANGSVEYEFCDWFALGGEGEVSVGKAEGKLTGSLGIVGGEFAAYAEASAEAIAGEVKGAGQVDLAGVKGKVGGSLNFGAGAHAKAGYKDGTLFFDVGVSVGPGASVYGELDISGLVDNIADGVSDTVDVISAFGSECGWW